MKRALACLLIVISLFLVACSPDKANAKNTVDVYLTALSSLDYDTANSLAVKGEEDLVANITQSKVNDKIFKNLKYQILNVSKNDNCFSVTLIITQLSLTTVYIDTVTDYSAYVEGAKLQGKTYSDSALKLKWDEFFESHLASADTNASFPCEAQVVKTDNGFKLLMTYQLRNALFGGALDAINQNDK